MLAVSHISYNISLLLSTLRNSLCLACCTAQARNTMAACSTPLSHAHVPSPTPCALLGFIEAVTVFGAEDCNRNGTWGPHFNKWDQGL